MNKNDIYFELNKRQYIRIDSVFPVEFQIISEDRLRTLSEIKEGFTRDIGKGGMSISTKVIKGAEIPQFIPKKTKLKLIINIPSYKEPLESFATLEWTEKFSGALLDTYTFGVSYDFINEIEYDRILNYIKWVKRKPVILTSLVGFFGVTTIAIIIFLISTDKLQNISKGFLISKESLSKIEAELDSKKSEAIILQSELEDLRNKSAAEEKLRKDFELKKTELENSLKELEKEKKSLTAEVEALKSEESSLKEEALTSEESIPEKSSAEDTLATEIKSPEEKPDEKSSKISKETLKLEEDNYNKFRGLILQEKVQSLEIYCASHRSSIYYPAALFALAEIQYKNQNITFAKANYIKLVEDFSDSVYGLYASHRLNQINEYYNYSRYSLKDLGEQYSLPEMYDYRKIEPYIKK